MVNLQIVNNRCTALPVACLYLYMPLYVTYIIEYSILIKEMNWNGIETCFKAQIRDFKDCKLNY